MNEELLTLQEKNKLRYLIARRDCITSACEKSINFRDELYNTTHAYKLRVIANDRVKTHFYDMRIVLQELTDFLRFKDRDDTLAQLKQFYSRRCMYLSIADDKWYWQVLLDRGEYIKSAEVMNGEIKLIIVYSSDTPLSNDAFKYCSNEKIVRPNDNIVTVKITGNPYSDKIIGRYIRPGHPMEYYNIVVENEKDN